MPRVPLLALACVFVFSTASFARISAAMKCEDLLNNSEVIVKGEVVSVGRNWRLNLFDDLGDDHNDVYAQKLHSHQEVAIIKIDRVIKGNVSGKRLKVYFYQLPWHNGTDTFIDVKPHEYSIFFLKTINNKLRFLDLDNGKIPGIRGGANTPNTDSRIALQDEILKLITDSDPNNVTAGLQCLPAWKTLSQFTPELNNLAKSDNLGIRYRSIALLAQSGNPESIQELVSILNSDKHPQELQQVGFDVFLALDQIRQKKTPEATLRLVGLLQNEKPAIRREALQAFRELKDRRTIQYAAKLLVDPDRDVRYVAMMTICEQISPNGTGCPSTTLFKPNEAKYLNQWKTWWDKNKTELK